MTVSMNKSVHILGMRINPLTYKEAIDEIMQLAIAGSGSYVCVGNVHMVVEAYNDAEFRQMVNAAALVTSDGMPLVWGLRFRGMKNAERVYGPCLTPLICEEAQKQGIPVGFYGGTEESLELMLRNLKTRFQSLNIAYAYSHPFRTLTEEEDKKVIKDIIESGIKILFIGLGCPKQEKWMAEHRNKIPVVMLGVGAAFDFIAGVKPQAPRWMGEHGFEWLFRLATEPKRLWRRYLINNTLFIYYIALEFFSKVSPFKRRRL